MAETVQIKATEKLRAFAKIARDIQDACNPMPVTKVLTEVLRYWVHDAVQDGQQYCGGDMSLQNPVTVSLINKLNHLAHMKQSGPHGKADLFLECMDLAEGKDVEIVVEWLVPPR